MGNRGTSVAPCDLYEVERRLGAAAGRRPADVQALVPAGRPRSTCSTIRASPTTTCAGSTATSSTTSCRRGARQDQGRGRWPLLEAAKLPAAPLHSPQEVLDDPHVEAMGYLQRVAVPRRRRAPVPIIETPFRMSATPGHHPHPRAAARRAHRRDARRDRLRRRRDRGSAGGRHRLVQRCRGQQSAGLEVAVQCAGHPAGDLPPPVDPAQREMVRSGTRYHPPVLTASHQQRLAHRPYASSPCRFTCAGPRKCAAPPAIRFW